MAVVNLVLEQLQLDLDPVLSVDFSVFVSQRRIIQYLVLVSSLKLEDSNTNFKKI